MQVEATINKVSFVRFVKMAIVLESHIGMHEETKQRMIAIPPNKFLYFLSIFIYFNPLEELI